MPPPKTKRRSQGLDAILLEQAKERPDSPEVTAMLERRLSELSSRGDPTLPLGLTAFFLVCVPLLYWLDGLAGAVTALLVMSALVGAVALDRRNHRRARGRLEAELFRRAKATTG